MQNTTAGKGDRVVAFFVSEGRQSTTTTGREGVLVDLAVRARHTGRRRGSRPGSPTSIAVESRARDDGVIWLGGAGHPTGAGSRRSQVASCQRDRCPSLEPVAQWTEHCLRGGGRWFDFSRAYSARSTVELRAGSLRLSSVISPGGRTESARGRSSDGGGCAQ